MTFKNTPFKTTASRLLFVGLMSGIVVGCAAKTPQETSDGADYRQNHPVQVTREQVSLSVTLPDQGLALSPSDLRRFRVFLRDFVQRGRTAVTVESQMPSLAKAILMQGGLRENEIVLASRTTILAPNAVLSFTANKVIAPECGDWSSSTSLITSNKPHSNYGCAMQRNIGSVVADPGDFIQSQPATGGAAGRTDEAIRTHTSGAVKTRLLDGNAAQ